MRIEAPVKEPGTIIGVGGIEFVDGIAETDNAAVISYCQGAGYIIDGHVVEQAAEPEPPDPTKIGTNGDGIEPLNTLRDAAVDPRPEDFLPPTNAGQANPHGPDVVSPELHGSQGTRPVLEGPVADEPAVQEAAETADVVEVTEVELERPKGNASHADWVTYAVAQGADRDEAEKVSRDDLVEAYG